MKKSIILILGLSLALTSCAIDWKDDNKTKIEKLEKINNETSNKVINVNNNNNNYKENKQINNIKINYNDFTNKLIKIENEGLETELIDKNNFNDFLNSYSGSEYIGEVENWIKSLSTNCNENITNTAVFSSFLQNEKDTQIPIEKLCYKDINDNKTINEIFEFLKNGNKSFFTLEEYDDKKIKSNSKILESTPITPLEKIITSQIFYGGAVIKIIKVMPYKNNILVISAGSQESGIPRYNIDRIYNKDSKLFIKTLNIQLEKINIIYGKDFFNKLYDYAYEINTGTGNNNKYNSEEIRLIKGDWLESPSIIINKIEMKIIDEILNFKIF